MTLDIDTIAPEALADEREQYTIVDVREPRDYRELGHIPGAANVPFERIRDRSADAAGRLPTPATVRQQLSAAGVEQGDPLVAYDNSRGVEAARFLLTAAVYGHDGPLYLLEGDFDVWQHDNETERGPGPEGSSEYGAVALDADAIVDRATVEAAIDADEGAVLVDTRTAGEYESAHLPGAVHLGWEAFVDAETDRLKPASELRTLLESRGLSPDDEILLYCNTARRLSHTYAVLSSLGYDEVRFYEGELTGLVRANSPAWDPQELYHSVRAVAPEGFDALPAELGDDIFSRLHLLGLYTTRQDGYFMLRTKIPGGQLTAEQARTVGRVADEFATAPPEHGGSEQNSVFGDGFLDVTTRQGIQMHWIRIEDMPEIWDRFESVGLTTIQASGNTLRNVVICPAAGVGHETVDVRGLAEDVADAFEGSTRYANLPRKFKVSLSGCHENCGRAELQDLGFVPAVKDGRDGFAVKVGGGLSDGPRAATDLGVFVPPERVVDLSLAAADLFIDHGAYLDTAVNRLKYIVDRWGTDRFREELESYVDFEFEPYDELLTTEYRGDHVGIHEQADGNHTVGLNLPTGRIRGDELRTLADIAERYGSGGVRTTANQNLVVPDVRGEVLESMLGEPLLSSYSPDPGPFSRGIVTCTGREFCKYGVIETKSRGYRWAKELDAWLDDADIPESAVPEAVRIHMSGCSASCAQPQIGDIGLRGEAYRDETQAAQAVDVGLGGDLGRDQFVDWVSGRIPVGEVPTAVKRVLRRFVETRRDGETFAEWADRTDIERLDRIVTTSTHPQEAD